VGYGPETVYFVGLTAAIITLIGVYYAGSAYGCKSGGLWAAAFWTFICSDLWLWANQPNTEVGMNACLIWAFALMVRANGKKIQFWRWVTIGLLFAIATLYKPVAITFAVLLSISYLLISLRDKKQIKIALLQVCIIGATGAVVWGAVFGYFAITGRFRIFYDTIVTYGGHYTKSRGGSVFKNIAYGFSSKRFFATKAMKTATVLAVLTAVGIIVGLCKKANRRHWLLLLGFVLAAPIAVALPGRFYNHYYQLWLCPLVVAAGWALTTIGPKNKSVSTVVCHSLGAIAVAIVIFAVWPQYKLSPDEWSVYKQGPQYIISKQVADVVDKLLAPDETFYVLGINPEIYFWAKRRPPTGVIWSTDMVNNPLAQSHTKRALKDLDRKPPEIIVFNLQHAQIPNDHPIVEWASKRYVSLPGNPYSASFRGGPLFYVSVLKNGKLANRLGIPEQKL